MSKLSNIVVDYDLSQQPPLNHVRFTQTSTVELTKVIATIAIVYDVELPQDELTFVERFQHDFWRLAGQAQAEAVDLLHSKVPGLTLGGRCELSNASLGLA